jgi:hypothetical protein
MLFVRDTRLSGSAFCPDGRAGVVSLTRKWQCKISRVGDELLAVLRYNLLIPCRSGGRKREAVSQRCEPAGLGPCQVYWIGACPWWHAGRITCPSAISARLLPQNTSDARILYTRRAFDATFVDRYVGERLTAAYFLGILVERKECSNRYRRGE